MLRNLKLGLCLVALSSLAMAGCDDDEVPVCRPTLFRPCPKPDAGTPPPVDASVPDPFCGDGNLDSGEECDDGNSASGDGCSADCAITASFPTTFGSSSQRWKTSS